MSRDSDKDPDDDNKAPSNVNVSAGNNHPPDKGHFQDSNTDDEYEYEEPDRDTDYGSGYGADSDNNTKRFNNETSGDEEQELFSFEEEPEHFREPDEPAVEDPNDWPEDRESYNDTQRPQAWPLGLIAVAAVALMLLAAGGYGVMQERAAIEEELGQLREILTTVANSEGAGVNRKTLETLQQSYDRLAQDAETLMRENRGLRNTVSALEIELDASNMTLAASKTVVASPVTTEAIRPASAGTKPLESARAGAASAASKPTTAEPAATTPSKTWFVNVSSFSTRANAEQWAAKVKPIAANVTVAPTNRDGKTYYRVRVAGLANKSVATALARELETSLSINNLWVGLE